LNMNMIMNNVNKYNNNDTDRNTNTITTTNREALTQAHNLALAQAYNNLSLVLTANHFNTNMLQMSSLNTHHKLLTTELENRKRMMNVDKERLTNNGGGSGGGGDSNENKNDKGPTMILASTIPKQTPIPITNYHYGYGNSNNGNSFGVNNFITQNNAPIMASQSIPNTSFHSSLLNREPKKMVNTTKGQKKVFFPVTLYRILEDVAMADRNMGTNLETIVSWVNDGRAFKIHQPEVFNETILPKYSKRGKITRHYRSFQRQLNIYGFKMNQKSGIYWHDSFHRGCGIQSLTLNIRPTPIKNAYKRKKKSSSNRCSSSSRVPSSSFSSSFSSSSHEAEK